MNTATRPTLVLGSDHAGVELKRFLQDNLTECDCVDVGPSSSMSVDYPDFAHKACREVLEDPDLRLGVLICGSGIGMSMAANRMDGIRAALVENPYSARLAREHNHANVLCLGARILAPAYALEIVRTWLTAIPSLDERHLSRIRKITPIV